MSFILILIYLALTFIRPQDWVPVFFDKPIVLGVSLAAIFFIFFERFGQTKAGLSKVPQIRLMVLLYIAVLMSHLSNTYIFGLSFAFQSFLVIFILFFIMLNGIDREWKFKVSVWFIVFLITVLVFQGIYQINNGYGWAGQSLTLQGGQLTELVKRINWVGIFSDPNDLALTFVMAVGISMAFLFGRTGFFARIFNLMIIAVLLYGIFLTNSRGGLLALMTTVYFYMVRRTRKFVVGGIVGGLLAFGILAVGPSRMGLITVSEDSAYGRVELWYEGIQLLKSRPIFGVGYDMFTDALPQTAHNSYVLAASELGMFGLFCWVGLIFCSFKGLSIVQATEPKYYNYALGLQSSLIGFCAAAFFLSRTYVILPYMLFSLSGSLMYITKQQHPDIEFLFTRKDAWITLVLSFAVLLMAFLVVKIGI